MHAYHHTFKTEAEAKAFIEGELGRWHPMGYGTWFRAPVLQPDGQWLVTGSRSNSCD